MRDVSHGIASKDFGSEPTNNMTSKPVIFIAAFFIALFLYTKFAGPIPFFINSVQTTKTTLFQAEGSGEVAAIPNTATISFGVTKNAATVADAQNQTNSIVQKVMDGLKKLGIDEKNIKTTNYSVNPNYALGSQIIGYTVTQQVEIKISPLDKVNATLDTLTANGANVIGQVNFGFDADTKKSLENKAREMAVADAKDKAESLARAAGIRLGKIVDVQETGTVPVIRPLALEKTAGSTPTEVTPGENTIQSTITLSYETY